MKQQDIQIIALSLLERQRSEDQSQKDLVALKNKENLFTHSPLENVAKRPGSQRRPGTTANLFTITILSHGSSRGKFAWKKCLTNSGLSVCPTKEPSDREWLLNKGGLPMN